MSEFLNITNDYINKIREDEVCKEYFRQKELVSTQYPDLKKQIDEFRYRNFKLQNETDADRLFDETDRFEREYEEFRKNPIVSDFLAAELAMLEQELADFPLRSQIVKILGFSGHTSSLLQLFDSAMAV